MKARELKSGGRMPQLGFGTWRLQGESVETPLKIALETGYTHIDTAAIYGNHRNIGKIIKAVHRESLFITSKVWNTDATYDRVHSECVRALEELGIDYLDLYLLHFPADVPIAETLKAMDELRKQGKIRAVGVSNFDVEKLKEALETGIVIDVNQVEFHPWLYQKDLLDFCRDNGIILTAYAPLGRAKLFDDEIRKIAEKHGVSQAQVSIRWCLQKGTIAIPKASSREHIQQNFDVFGFELDEEDLHILDNRHQTRLVNVGKYA